MVSNPFGKPEDLGMFEELFGKGFANKPKKLTPEQEFGKKLLALAKQFPKFKE